MTESSIDPKPPTGNETVRASSPSAPLSTETSADAIITSPTTSAATPATIAAQPQESEAPAESSGSAASPATDNDATRKALDRLRKLKEDAEAGAIPGVKPSTEEEAQVILANAATEFMKSAENKAAGPEPVRESAPGKRDAPTERMDDLKRQRSERPNDFNAKVAARADRFGENVRDTTQRLDPKDDRRPTDTYRPRADRLPPNARPRPSTRDMEDRSPRPSPRKPDMRPAGPPPPRAYRQYDDRPPYDDRRPVRPIPRDYPDVRRDNYGPPGPYRREGPDERYREPPHGALFDDRRAYRPPSPPPRAPVQYGRPVSPARSDNSRGGGPARRPGPPGPPQPYPDPRGYDAREAPYPRGYAAPGPYANSPPRRYASSPPPLSAPVGARPGPLAGEPRYAPAYKEIRPPPPATYNAAYRDDRPRGAPAAYDRDPYAGQYPPAGAYDDRGPPPPFNDRYAQPAPPPPAPLASELDYLKSRMAELERLAAASAAPPPPPPPRDYRERISVGRNTRFHPEGPPAVVRSYDSVRREDDDYYARRSPPPVRRPQEARGSR